MLMEGDPCADGEHAEAESSRELCGKVEGGVRDECSRVRSYVLERGWVL